MKNESMRISKSLTLSLFLTGLGLCGRGELQAGQAQPDLIQLVPGSPALNKGETLPMELVEMRPAGVVPGTIHRKAGRFLLIVSNLNPSTVNAGFVIDPAAVGDLKLGATPLLSLGGKAVSDQKSRSAGVFQGNAGSFDLKDAATGKILCKILLE